MAGFTVSVWSWTARNNGITNSNPTQGMDMYLHFCCITLWHCEEPTQGPLSRTKEYEKNSLLQNYTGLQQSTLPNISLYYAQDDLPYMRKTPSSQPRQWRPSYDCIIITTGAEQMAPRFTTIETRRKCEISFVICLTVANTHYSWIDFKHTNKRRNANEKPGCAYLPQRYQYLDVSKHQFVIFRSWNQTRATLVKFGERRFSHHYSSESNIRRVNEYFHSSNVFSVPN